MFAHGIERGPGAGAVTSPPLATHIIAAGHAWAASGYRAREYRPDWLIAPDDRRGTQDLLVQRVMRAPSHCGFYDGETREQAFDDPVASDLSRIGLKWTPVLHAGHPLAVGR